jgi:hypothetical protein
MADDEIAPTHQLGRVQKRIPRPTAPSSRGKTHPKTPSDHEGTHAPDTHIVPEGLPKRGVPYPWNTVGYIETSIGRSGAGVLVGSNFFITSGRLVPWGPNPWWMRFAAGFNGPPIDVADATTNKVPYGWVYVEECYGYETVSPGPNDYVICKLFSPLGDETGWMGTEQLPNTKDYITSWPFVAFIPSVGDAILPEVSLPIPIEGVEDVNFPSDMLFISANMDVVLGLADDPAQEFTGGVVGCPLVKGWPDIPYVIAVQSGQTGETGDDGYKPYVGWSAGGDMVKLVWYGRDNW